jgi:hypothetical protein
MLRFRPVTLLLALLALAVAGPQAAQAAAPSAKRCKAVKAKKHKTKRDRVTLTACRKAAAAKAARAKKKKAVAQQVSPEQAPSSVPVAGAAVPATPAAPAVGTTPTAAPTPTPTPAPTVPQIPTGSGRAVQVRGFEFGLNLSRAQVLTGSVRVEYNLASAEDPHTLILFREDGTGATYSFDEQPSGSVVAKSLPLTAGAWKLVCDLPQHADRGMVATLTVG